MLKDYLPNKWIQGVTRYSPWLSRNFHGHRSPRHLPGGCVPWICSTDTGLPGIHLVAASPGSVLTPVHSFRLQLPPLLFSRSVLSDSATPWTAAHQASLFFTVSRSLLKPMSIEPMMPSDHLILCHPLLLLPSIFPSIRVFSNESVLRIRWPKYWELQLQHQSFQWIFRIDFL